MMMFRLWQNALLDKVRADGFICPPGYSLWQTVGAVYRVNIKGCLFNFAHFVLRDSFQLPV